MSDKVKHIILRSWREGEIFLGWGNNYSTIKQNAFLFDQIGVVGLSNLRQVTSSVTKNKKLKLVTPQLKATLLESEWLEENGIIFEPKIEDEIKFDGFKELIDTSPVAKSEIDFLLNSINKKMEKQKSDSTLDQYFLAREKDGLRIRIMSIVMNATRKASVVNSLPYTEYAQKISKINKSIVSQIVINKLPAPDNTTPWEKIIEYRNDPDTHKKLTALRRWINRTATQYSTPLEIEEEIESLINDFQDHMKIHKMKANTETLEVMVKAPLEIIENLIKLKFSKIPEPLFALKKRQINLMEAELSVPNREMAYIIKTKEAFESLE